MKRLLCMMAVFVGGCSRPVENTTPDFVTTTLQSSNGENNDELVTIDYAGKHHVFWRSRSHFYNVTTVAKVGEYPVEAEKKP